MMNMTTMNTMTVTDYAALDLYEQFKRGVVVYYDDPEEQEEYWWYYRSQIEALYRKAEDEDMLILSNGGEEFPVKPSTRGERRKLTAHHKSREKRLKSNMQYMDEWVNNPTFHHDHTEKMWFSGKLETSHKEEVRTRKEVAQFMQTVPEPELTDEVWEQAWKDWEEEEYWERVEAQEWEDMQTFQEIEEFFSEEEERRSGLARDTSSGHLVWEYTVTCDGNSFVTDEKGANWLVGKLRAFHGKEAVKVSARIVH